MTPVTNAASMCSINPMPRGQIIAQRQETHFVAIANDAMEQTPDPLKRGRKIRRETMKTMLLAAAAALSLGVGSAYADGGDGPAANTFFTELPGVVAQAQVPNAPTYAQNGQQNRQAQAQSGQAAHGYGVYSTQSWCRFGLCQRGWPGGQHLLHRTSWRRSPG
jgi:hypothetical protein